MAVETEYPLLEKNEKMYFLPHIPPYNSLLQNLWGILVSDVVLLKEEFVVRSLTFQRHVQDIDSVDDASSNV